jgi:hypothetical protein
MCQLTSGSNRQNIMSCNKRRKVRNGNIQYENITKKINAIKPSSSVPASSEINFAIQFLFLFSLNA